MGRHTADITVSCPRCGAPAHRTVVAHARHGVLRAHESLRCPACGLAEEATGAELSDSARDAFYLAEGRWSTVLRDLGTRRLEALGVLRALLGATPAELKRRMDNQVPLLEGALVEIERVAEMLGDAGAAVTTTRVLPPRAT